MKFKGKFLGAKIDTVKFQQQLQEAMVNALHEGANAWLQAVVGKIPLWSGMARASLLELSELVGGAVVFTPLRAKSRIPKGRPLGSAKQTIQENLVTIEITTNVPHYNVFERRSGTSPTAPWKSLQAGASAYTEAIKNYNFPKPTLKPINIKAI